MVYISGCDICNENPEECPMHGPLHSLRKLVNQSQIDSPIDYSAVLKFPDEVGLCTSSIPGIEYGVCAKATIPSGTWIGPYEGRLVRPEQIKRGTETEYMWEVGRILGNVANQHTSGFPLQVCSYQWYKARNKEWNLFIFNSNLLQWTTVAKNTGSDHLIDKYIVLVNEVKSNPYEVRELEVTS